MHKLTLLFALIATTGSVFPAACQAPQSKGSETPSTPSPARFNAQQLKAFAALNPIDAHTHVYSATPAFYTMLTKFNLHILDIMVSDDTDPEMQDLGRETKDAWSVADRSDGRVAMCTTFDAYAFGKPGFSEEAIRKIDADFARGAVAVKLYKNFGMEIKDRAGHYVMPDAPELKPILRDIEAHDRTLIGHLADPRSVWEAPNPAAPDYEYLVQHPELYMYGRQGVPSKVEILQARDRVISSNTGLRIVGAHLGSMESDLSELGAHLQKYPNFAVDLAARMVYFETQPREKMIAFIQQYQDRLIYGTDNEVHPDQESPEVAWEHVYLNDWRYLGTTETITTRYGKTQGLGLSASVLQKIYHDNAVTWFPGILGRPAQPSR
jgi:predicted TIM-barrel fold metal-dependent hydrolase